MAALIQYAGGVPAIKFSLDELNTYIGRDSESDICLADKFVSKLHAMIEVCESTGVNREFIIRDLGSTNKTYVNRQPINYINLSHQDIIRIGGEEFIFEHDHSDTVPVRTKPVSVQRDEAIPLESDLEKDMESGDKFSRRLKFS